MLVNCATSCKETQHEAMRMASLVEQELAHVDDFFDLSAKDIDGNVIKFETFRGKVTILTNVATYCGRTAAHYKGLVELWAQLSASFAETVNILAFPCNQFVRYLLFCVSVAWRFASSCTSCHYSSRVCAHVVENEWNLVWLFFSVALWCAPVISATAGRGV